MSQEQIQYAATDSAVSLEAGEKLLTMPDFTRCLLPEELIPNTKVDLISRNRSTACMTTHAATQQLLTPCNAHSLLAWYMSTERKSINL